jgi:hypothetical protein
MGFHSGESEQTFPATARSPCPRVTERKALNDAAQASSRKDGQGSGVYEARINQSLRGSAGHARIDRSITPLSMMSRFQYGGR